MLAQSVRLEIPVKIYLDKYQVIPLDQQGFILVQEGPEKSYYTIQKFGTFMQEEWSFSTPIQARLRYHAHYYSGQNLYILFDKALGNKLAVLKIDLLFGTWDLVETNTLKNLNIIKFVAWEEDVYIYGKVLSLPSIFYLNLQTKNTTALSTDLRGNAELSAFYVDPKNHWVHTSVVKGSKFHPSQVQIQSYFQGRLQRDVQLPHQDRLSLLNGQLVSLDKNEALIFGNYTLGNFIGDTQGVYVARLDSNQQIKNIKYHDFAQLKNYFNYLKPEKRAQIRHRIHKKNDRDRVFPLSYRTHLQPILQLGSTWVLINNAYEGELSSQNLNYHEESAQMWNGWVYHYSTVLAFDKKGRLLWDNTLSLAGARSYSLDPSDILQMHAQKDTLSFVYLRDGQIIKQRLQGGANSPAHHQFLMGTGNPEDKIRESYQTQLLHWYGPYYLLWGFQRLQGTEGKRRVFYIQKIRL